MGIHFAEQIGHSTLTFLEINEDDNYKVTIFDQSQKLFEKFIRHERFWYFALIILQFWYASFLSPLNLFNCNLCMLLASSNFKLKALIAQIIYAQIQQVSDKVYHKSNDKQTFIKIS